MSSLTEDQRKMIEEKKKAAQAKLASRLTLNSTLQSSSKTNNQNTSLKSETVISSSPSGKSVRIKYENNVPKTKSKPVQGTCELTSIDRFTVNVGYHQQLIETFKTIQSKNYGQLIFLQILHGCFKW